MNDSDSLIRADAALCTIETPDDDNVFLNFRKVFAAARCLNRVVYWCDEKFGQTRLRKRLLAERSSKKDDQVVAVFPGKPNLDALRMAIAANNSGKLMTGIRWELYADFPCRELVAQGRFDHVDLLADADVDRLKNLAQTGTLSLPTTPEDWDFDAILLTHRCPICRKTYGKESLVFDPEYFVCEHCKSAAKSSNRRAPRFEPVSGTLTTARHLMLLVVNGPQGILSTENQSDDIRDIDLMLDVHATPLFTWLLCSYFGNPECSDKRDEDNGHEAQLGPANMRACYQQSILPKFKIDFVAQAFEDYLVSRTQCLIDSLKQRPPKFLPEGVSPEAAAQYAIASNLKSIEDVRSLVRSVRALNDRVFRPFGGRGKDASWTQILEDVRQLPLYIDDILLEIGKDLKTNGATKEKQDQ